MREQTKLLLLSGLPLSNSAVALASVNKSFGKLKLRQSFSQKASAVNTAYERVEILRYSAKGCLDEQKA